MALLDAETGAFDSVYRQFQWAIPNQFNIGIDVCAGLDAAEDAIALYYENAQGHAYRYRFGELRQYSDQLANAWLAWGLERGDRVAIILSQRPETALSHIAAYKAGAVALPLSILFGPDALSYRLNNSQSRVVVTDEAHLALVEKLQPELPHLEQILACDVLPGGGFWDFLNSGAATPPGIETRADDPALLIYTSGTTGPPKGALVAHRSLLGNLTGFEASHNFYAQNGGPFWTPADWAWTGGLMDALLPTLHYGQPILGYEGGGAFDAEKACQLMEKYQVKNAFIPPTAMKMLMQVPDIAKRYHFALETVMSAGEAVGERIIHWARDEWGVAVNEMWGQTEFNYLVGNCSVALKVKPGSMGKPYPGHRVDVVDERGEPKPTGEIGELAAHRDDPVMFLGYWENEQATQAKFLGPWFLTGDMGYRDEDGYLWFVGRKDDVISSAGYRIGPGEIEDCLLKHPAVVQAAVIGAPDELRGNIVKAFIVLAEGYRPGEQLTAEIQTNVKQSLAAYEYPREIEYLDQLPLTTTGKVRRMELRQRELEKRSKT